MGRRQRSWSTGNGFSIAELRQMLDDREQQQSSLGSRRAALVAELAELEDEIAALGGEEGLRPGRPVAAPAKRGPGRPPKTAAADSKGKVGRPAGAKGEGPLHRAIRAAMTDATEPMKIAAIAEKVKAGGYETKSKNFGVILGLRLTEMADIKRVERGLYALVGSGA